MARLWHARPMKTHLTMLGTLLALGCSADPTITPPDASLGMAASGQTEAATGSDAVQDSGTDSGTDAAMRGRSLTVAVTRRLTPERRAEFQGVIGTDWSKPGGRQCAARKWAMQNPDDIIAWLRGEDNRIASMPKGKGRGPHGLGGDGREIKRSEYFAMAVAIAKEEPAFVPLAIDFIKNSILDWVEVDEFVTYQTAQSAASSLEKLAPESIDALRELMHAGERLESLYRPFTSALSRLGAITDVDREYLEQRQQFVPLRAEERNKATLPPAPEPQKPSDDPPPPEMIADSSERQNTPPPHECSLDEAP